MPLSSLKALPKGLVAILLAAAMLGPTIADDNPAPAESTATEAHSAAPAAPEASTTEKCETPALITDVGQGNNGMLLRAMMQRAGFATTDYKLEDLATADSLDGVKTLIIGVGASTKGLGAAGLDSQQERERTAKLVEAAKERKIPIIGVHMGGEARRGELSDQFNRQVFIASDFFVLWEGGNADGFFSRLSREHTDVQLVSVASRTGVGDELRKLLASSESAE